MRQKLLQNPSFNIMQAYNRIDATGKGFITASDIGKFLSKNRV